MSGTTPTHSLGGRKRSVARLAAVQALYQMDLSGTNPEPVIAEFIKHRLGREVEGDNYGEADTALFTEVVKGTIERQAELDRAIGEVLTPDWPLARLETVLRAVLRAGAYELLACPETPAAVIINEYLDIAHAFFAGKEPGLVNGVLDRLARSLRPGDIGEGKSGGAAAR